MKLELVLPLPLSLNQLYINQTRYDKYKKKYIPTGKRILSQKGKMNKKLLQKYAKKQMKDQSWNYELTKDNYIYMDTVIYFNKKGRDDNNIYKILCDALEKIAYDNDSRVLIRTQRIYYDKDEPRVELTLSPVEYVGIFDSKDDLKDFEDKCKTCSRYLNSRCSILNKAKEGRVQEEVEDKVCYTYAEKKT